MHLKISKNSVFTPKLEYSYFSIDLIIKINILVTFSIEKSMSVLGCLELSNTPRGVIIIIIIIIRRRTLFQEGDIYITIVNHDGPQNNHNNITM